MLKAVKESLFGGELPTPPPPLPDRIKTFVKELRRREREMERDIRENEALQTKFKVEARKLIASGKEAEARVVIKNITRLEKANTRLNGFKATFHSLTMQLDEMTRA